jgi:hypothetical protein
MKVKITGETIAAFDHVWLAPEGKKVRKLITVTSVVTQGDEVIVNGVLAGSNPPIPLRATIFTFAAVDMEV